MSDKPMCMMAGCCSGDGPHNPKRVHGFLVRTGAVLPLPQDATNEDAIRELESFVQVLKEYKP